MERTENVTEVLNDLIRINHDRIEGYERAINETKDQDADLQALFNRMADESRQFSRELEDETQRSGKSVPEGTTLSGKIYRVWMDIKSTFSGKSKKSVLELCEFGEDAAQRAYEEALRTDTPLPPGVRELIVNQKAALKSSHDTIKRYRDMHEGRRASE